MNKLLAILFIALFIAGCKKDNTVPKSIMGKWELRIFVSNGVAHLVYNYPAGNGYTIQFNKDSTYSAYDILAKKPEQGTFRIVKDGYDAFGLGKLDALYLSNSTDQQYIQFKGDTLNVVSPALQFSSKAYVRQ